MREKKCHSHEFYISLIQLSTTQVKENCSEDTQYSDIVTQTYLRKHIKHVHFQRIQEFKNSEMLANQTTSKNSTKVLNA